MNYIEALDYIENLNFLGSKLDLSRISEILKRLGDPQDKIKVIHVAGTNGKGSVSSMLTQILMDAGYKTALYTSPHLERYNERYKINNIEITDEMKSLAENMTKASGRSELKMYKNGFDLWLNSFQTSLVAVGGSAALGFLVGLIPGIGASLAGTLLAAILPVISGEYCPNGIFVSYRFNQYLRVRPQ